MVLRMIITSYLIGLGENGEKYITFSAPIKKNLIKLKQLRIN